MTPKKDEYMRGYHDGFNDSTEAKGKEAHELAAKLAETEGMRDHYLSMWKGAAADQDAEARERVETLETFHKEVWGWLLKRGLVDNDDDEWRGFVDVIEEHEDEIEAGARRSALTSGEPALPGGDDVALRAENERLRQALEAIDGEILLPGHLGELVAAALVSPQRETSWLIERKYPVNSIGATEPRWYAEDLAFQDEGQMREDMHSGRYIPAMQRLVEHRWTKDANEAKKFASKAEAEAYPAYQMIASDPAISVTEHVFLVNSSSARSHDALVAAAEKALHEMRHTVAPRNSFTDAVDALDAAISRAS